MFKSEYEPVHIQPMANTPENIDGAMRGADERYVLLSRAVKKYDVDIDPSLIVSYMTVADDDMWVESGIGLLVDINFVASLCVINLGLSKADTDHMLMKTIASTSGKENKFDRKFTYLFNTSMINTAVAYHVTKLFCIAHKLRGFESLPLDVQPAISEVRYIDMPYHIYPLADVHSVISRKNIFSLYAHATYTKTYSLEKQFDLKRHSLLRTYEWLTDVQQIHDGLDPVFIDTYQRSYPFKVEQFLVHRYDWLYSYPYLGEEAFIVSEAPDFEIHTDAFYRWPTVASGPVMTSRRINYLKYGLQRFYHVPFIPSDITEIGGYDVSEYADMTYPELLDIDVKSLIQPEVKAMAIRCHDIVTQHPELFYDNLHVVYGEPWWESDDMALTQEISRDMERHNRHIESGN